MQGRKLFILLDSFLFEEKNILFKISIKKTLFILDIKIEMLQGIIGNNSGNGLGNDQGIDSSFKGEELSSEEKPRVNIINDLLKVANSNDLKAENITNNDTDEIDNACLNNISTSLTKVLLNQVEPNQKDLENNKSSLESNSIIIAENDNNKNADVEVEEEEEENEEEEDTTGLVTRLIRLRQVNSERVEMEEKLRALEEMFMTLFGDRIPPKVTLSLTDKIELVMRQFNKTK